MKGSGDLEMAEKFGYVIKVDGKVVWEGRNPKEKYFDIRKQNPGKEIAIAWRTKEKNMVLKLRLPLQTQTMFHPSLAGSVP